jgi:hypothetical protein
MDAHSTPPAFIGVIPVIVVIVFVAEIVVFQLEVFLVFKLFLVVAEFLIVFLFGLVVQLVVPRLGVVFVGPIKLKWSDPDNF